MKIESLRKQIEQAKKNAEKILSKKESEETLLIKTLLIIIDVMIIAFLEKKIRKNSNNSGLPPSHDIGGSHNDRNNEENKKDNSKRGSQLDNSRTEIQVKTLTPEKCDECGADLSNSTIMEKEVRKKIDIEYVIVEETYTAETKKCSKCGEETKAEFPKGIDGAIQYGIGIKAAIMNFLIVQMMSLQRVQEHYLGLLGRSISQATMLKYITQFHESLKDWEDQAIITLLKATAMYVDETSMRVNKKNYWIHTYGFGDTVLLFIHKNRGTEAIDDIGILAKYNGIVVHDRYNPYFTYDHFLHALCAAHLLRDLKFVEESTGNKWATYMKILLTIAIRMVNSNEDKVLPEKKYKKLQRLYKKILSEGLSELPLFPAPKGKGRVKLTDAQNLWEAFLEHEESILLFAKVTEVDPTNNLAERNLRMSKVKKKVSGCFRNLDFAKCFCRIYSYVKTMRNKGYSSLQAITLALKGQIPS